MARPPLGVVLVSTPAQLWEALARAVDRRVRDRSDYAEVMSLLASDTGWTTASVFDLDEDGRLDPLSYRVRVSVAVADGWAPVAEVPWQELPLTLDEVRQEHAWAVAQREMTA